MILTHIPVVGPRKTVTEAQYNFCIGAIKIGPENFVFEIVIKAYEAGEKVHPFCSAKVDELIKLKKM